MIVKKEIIVEAINDNQVILYNWIDENKSKLKYVSEDTGCGCCISIVEIKREEKIINTLPKEILL